MKPLGKVSSLLSGNSSIKSTNPMDIAKDSILLQKIQGGI